MGNNNTSAIKEEDNTSEAKTKTHLDDIHADGAKEEDQVNPTATSDEAGTKAEEMVSVDTSELANEMPQEHTHEDCVKEPKVVLENAAKASDDTTIELEKDAPSEDNQCAPTSEAKVALETREKASDDTTIELEKDTPPPEDSHADDSEAKVRTVPTDKGKEVQEKATWPASNYISIVSENDLFEGDTLAGDAQMENQMHPTAEDEKVQQEATGLASDLARSKLGRGSLEDDTCIEDVNADKNPTAEGKEVEEIAASLALDEEAKDPIEDISQEDTHANDKDESALICFGRGTDYQEPSLDSDDAFNLRDSYGSAGKETLRKPEESPNAGAVEDGGEKCEVLSSSSLEDCGKQTKSCSVTKQEEEDTKVLTLDAADKSNEAELQDSPVVDSNHNDLIKVLSESSLQGSDSHPRGDFLDTNPLCPHDNDVIEGELQTQEKDISSEVRDRDEIESSLGDFSGTKSDSSSGNKSNDNSLSHDDFVESYKVLDEERKMRRSESTEDNSHHYNSGGLNEFKGCNAVNTNEMTNGDCDGEERNEAEVPKAMENGHHFDACDDASTVSEQEHLVADPEAEVVPLIAVSTVAERREDCKEKIEVGDNDMTIGSNGEERNEVEVPKATENGHHFEACDDDNLNKNSDVSEPEHLVVPEVEVVPIVAVSTVADFTEEGRDDYKEKIEDREEMLEQCNPQLVTIDHAESFTLQSSVSLSHIYDAFEKGLEDYESQHVEEATSNSEANLSNEQCPNNAAFENGGYETRESTTTTRLSTESNSDDSANIFTQIQKSPSFNLNLKIEANSSEESDQSPLLLYEDKCTTESMPVEQEKVVTMERSYTDKSSKAPLFDYSKEDEALLLVTSEEQEGNHGGTYEEVKEVASSNSPKPKEKKKHVSSFFINCMCCAATVAN